jgi:hypothetical protein
MLHEHIIVGAHVAPVKLCPPEVWSETQREFTADHKIVHAQIIVSGLAVNEQYFLSAAHVVNNIVHRSCVTLLPTRLELMLYAS